MAYQIIIDSIDRTADVIAKSVVVDEHVDSQQNTCNFTLTDLSGNGIPTTNDVVSITLNSGEVLWGGLIDRVRLTKKNKGGEVYAEIECVDYARRLDTKLVHEVYEDMSDRDVILGIISEFASGLGIDTSGVQGSTNIEQIIFNYIPVSRALDKVAKLSGYRWYLDYQKVLKYFPITTYAAPFDIDSSTSNYDDLVINKDGSQVKNRVYVKGGNRASDFTTYTEKGDGSKKEFVLPDKPHDVTVKVNGVTKTLGVFNIDSGKQWYLNFQEKYVVQDDSETILSETDELQVTYRYDIPILIAQNNDASITELGGDPEGIREFVITDKALTSHEAARARAAAELSEYAANIVEASFRTYTEGFHAGQYMNINLSDYDVNDNYIIQQVVAESIGGGDYVYRVKLASAKTLGIVGFLINMLETDQEQLTFDSNEAVDELLQITLDSLHSDSMLDSLTIDSAGPYRTWAYDSDASPTRARWNLFQWK